MNSANATNGYEAAEQNVIDSARAIWVKATTPNFPGGGFDQRGVQRAYKVLKAHFGDTRECWSIWMKEVAV